MTQPIDPAGNGIAHYVHFQRGGMHADWCMLANKCMHARIAQANLSRFSLLRKLTLHNSSMICLSASWLSSMPWNLEVTRTVGADPTWLCVFRALPKRCCCCRGPFLGARIVQAHMCGRLPRDTLVAAHAPEVPSAVVSADIPYFFRCVCVCGGGGCAWVMLWQLHVLRPTCALRWAFAQHLGVLRLYTSRYSVWAAPARYYRDCRVCWCFGRMTSGHVLSCCAVPCCGRAVMCCAEPARMPQNHAAPCCASALWSSSHCPACDSTWLASPFKAP